MHAFKWRISIQHNVHVVPNVTQHTRKGVRVLKTFFKTYIYFSVRLLSVIRRHSFFPSPPQRSMTSDFEGFSIPDFIHHIYFPILILWYDAVLDLGLNSGPPALETSTLPLGYRRGGIQPLTLCI